MFLWQARIAVIQLMDPPVVDLTERLSIVDIEPLLITICPLEQRNYTELDQYGYGHEVFLLLGEDNSETLNSKGKDGGCSEQADCFLYYIQYVQEVVTHFI